MKLTVNGEARETAGSPTLQQLLETLNPAGGRDHAAGR